MVFLGQHPIDIFDSNIWILGLTERNVEATALLQEVWDGDRSVAVSAYIYDEVFEAFDRDLSGADIQQAKNNFSNLVFKSQHVDGPETEEIKNMDLHRVRRAAVPTMMSRVIGVEAKDIPILVLAWQNREDEPTVFTADRPFSRFEPSNYGLDELSIERVDVD